MYETIKKEIKEIVEIVKQCPNELQEKCFEILLNQLLKDASSKSKDPKIQPPLDNVEKDKNPMNTEKQDTDNGKNNDDEISYTLLHIKTRKLLEQGEVSVKDFNNIYYKENGVIKPLYEDLGTTKMSDSQIRLTLLSAFENGLLTGEFEINGETVRQRCQDMKCYDMSNFAGCFTRSKTLFDNFEKYNKDENIKLSNEGKTELIKVLKYLSSK